MSRPLALVRRPGPRLADGLITHIDRSPVDLDRARAQWEEYVAALTAADWAVLEVPPADDCPDAVFVEDAVVVHEDVAVIT
ncbi:MAG: N(G),N(G)-dimethylarginine dimethylaminohydrolase, partial [Nostocoides sp.]